MIAHRQRREKVANVLRSEIPRVTAVVKENVPTYPRDIRLLGASAVAPLAEPRSHQLQQPIASAWVGRRDEMRERNPWRQRHWGGPLGPPQSSSHPRRALYQ